MLKSSLSIRALFALATGVVLFGAGCSWLPSSLSSPTSTAQVPTGPKNSTFDGLTSEQAAQKINFIPGSHFEMRQTVFGMAANLGAMLAGSGKEGTRVVVMDRFAPREVASLSWKLSSKVESDDSIKVRAEAQKAGKPMPEPVMVEAVQTGTLDGMDLKNSHLLYLPALWPVKDHASSLGTSGIWLSADAYDELDKGRVATLDFGLLNSQLQGALGVVGDLRTALAKLEGTEKTIDSKVDVYKLTGEKDLINWPLNVNGKDIQVSAIRAKSWFGELIVLHSAQNPMILKFTPNPVALGVADIASGTSPFGSFIGYEVTSIGDAQE